MIAAPLPLNSALPNYSGMSDAELDAAYGEAVDARNQAAINAIASEIVDNRLATVTGFLGGLFGRNRFPIYAAKNQAGFAQNVAAQQSTLTSAVNVGTAIKETATSGVNKIFYAAVVLILIFGALIIYFKLKK